MPIYLSFTTSGGGGSYTWTDFQTVSRTGSISFTNGATVDAQNSHTETPDNTYTPGWTARFYDAPGLAQTRSIDGTTLTVASADVTWNFTLKASVSSGGMTAQCPTVSWTAHLRWRTVRGKATVTGSDKVINP